MPNMGWAPPLFDKIKGSGTNEGEEGQEFLETVIVVNQIMDWEGQFPYDDDMLCVSFLNLLILTY